MSFADILAVGMVLLLFRPLAGLCAMAARAPQESLGGRWLLFEAVRSRPVAWGLVCSLGVLGFALGGWPAGEAGGVLKAASVVIAVPLVWAAAFSHLNPWTGRTHAVERLLCVALLVGLWFSPGFGAALVAVLLLQRAVLDRTMPVPLSTTDGRLATDGLIAVSALGVVSCVIPASPSAWVFVLLCVFGSSYLVPGVAKLRVGPRPGWWATQNRLSNLAASCRLHGWRMGLSDAGFARFAGVLRKFNGPLLWGTLAIEVGAVLVFADVRVAIALLLAASAMHAGIFLLTGICFWKWVVFNGALIGVLVATPAGAIGGAFGPAALVLGLAACALSPLWLRPIGLAWCDTRLTHLFDVEAVLPDGRAVEVPRNAWAPYDLAFAQGRFGFLCDAATLVGACGCHTRRGRELADLAERIELSGDDPRAIAALLDSHGERRRDEIAASRMERFVQKFLTNGAGRRRWFLGVPPPPPHLWFLAREPKLCRGDPAPELVRIVRRDIQYRDDGVFTEVASMVVLEVRLKSAGEAGRRLAA